MFRPNFIVLILLASPILYLILQGEVNIFPGEKNVSTLNAPEIAAKPNTQRKQVNLGFDESVESQFSNNTTLTDQQIISLKRPPVKVLPENQLMRSQIPENAMTLESLINNQIGVARIQEFEALKSPFQDK